MARLFLSVIIPAYNEAERLPRTLLDIDRYLSSPEFAKLVRRYGSGFTPSAYEILVVSDGSKDKTAEVAKKFAAMIRNLSVVDNSENHGKGYVVRQGMLEAHGKYRLFTDADNSTSIDHIERLLPEFQKGYDVVVCSRAVKGSTIAVHQPFYKELLGKLGNLFIQVAAVWGVWDTQCGFKAVTEKAAKDIFPKMIIDRWGFDVEMLALARALGYKIKEVPVNWVNDPKTHVKFSSYFQVLGETVKVRFNLWRNRYGIRKRKRK